MPKLFPILTFLLFRVCSLGASLVPGGPCANLGTSYSARAPVPEWIALGDAGCFANSGIIYRNFDFKLRGADLVSPDAAEIQLFFGPDRALPGGAWTFIFDVSVWIFPVPINVQPDASIMMSFEVLGGDLVAYTSAFEADTRINGIAVPYAYPAAYHYPVPKPFVVNVEVPLRSVVGITTLYQEVPEPATIVQCFFGLIVVSARRVQAAVRRAHQTTGRKVPDRRREVALRNLQTL